MENKSTLKFFNKNLDYQEKGHIWSEGWIDPSLIISFPQVRKTFDKVSLQELADDIAKKGLLQPSMVAKLSLDNFQIYLDIFEKITKSKLDRANFPFEKDSFGNIYYYVLVAGERRFRAHMILMETGCTECINTNNFKKNKCFLKHFPKGLIEVRIGFNIKPEEAKSVQFRENNHIRPSVHEEAYAYRDYYDYLKTVKEKMTFKDFSIEVGSSIDKVRKAIWFCDLPLRLRDAVENKMISYSNALEMNKIIQDSFFEKDIYTKIINSEIDYLFIHPKIKNEDYKIRIKNLILSFKTPTLFDLNQLEMTKKEKRKVVEIYLLQKILLMDRYSEKTSKLLSDGFLGKGNLYSGISPTKQIKKILLSIESIIPNFKLTNSQKKSLFFNLDKKP